MKKYKSLTYRAKGPVNSQSVLDDLSRFLNYEAEHGWNMVSVQYTGSTGFLIIMERTISEPEPESKNYLLQETGEYLLQEDNYKIIL